MFTKLKSRISKAFQRVFSDLYEVTIYELGPDGVQFENKLQLSRIDKISDRYIKGRDQKGLLVMYSSKDPFSYYVKQIY